jgi:hypothetical protein
MSRVGRDTRLTVVVHMIVLGLILLIIGLVAKISILWTLGIIVLVIGIIFYILGAVGRPVGGRKVWF